MASIATTAEAARVELTWRGMVLGVLITLVFTAANVYLGLRVGLTVATSIPAAVISMGVLRAFRDATIWENNIVQTVASAAGAMASVIFVLPGLVIVGAWASFPFWTTFLLCALGGVLGVMFTIPLRRALVTTSDLPYPEGVAAAQVLAVGSGERAGAAAAAEGKAGLAAIMVGSVTSLAFAALTKMRLLAEEADAFVRLPNGGATGIGFSMSLALVGVGHLVGAAVGAAMLLGLVIAGGVAVPVLTGLAPQDGSAADVAQAVWTAKVRFIGAGAIGTAAIWTLLKLAAPVWRGLASAMAAQRRRSAPDAAVLPRVEQDLPIGIVGLVSGLCLIPIAFVLARFVAGGPLGAAALPLVAASVVYIAVAGFAVAAVCGYMAGLIGSSNSPVSGLAILSVLGASLIVAAIGGGAGGDTRPLVAFALVVTAVLLAAAVSANDNLQDLKTGQLVDATPWRQQAALVVGVVAGSAVIPPILELLNRSNGFAGAPNLLAISDQPLPAPQATLISTIAKGVIDHQLDWGMIGIGVALGVVLIAIDEGLRRTKRYSLPPLAVGMAIYLPAALTVPVILGAFAGWWFNRRHGETARRLAVLVVSGLIVGESLFNVALAGLIVATNNPAPIAVAPEGFPAGVPLALILVLLVGAGLYAWSSRRAARA
jgi:putative OPT family oligopeptide transporter